MQNSSGSLAIKLGSRDALRPLLRWRLQAQGPKCYNQCLSLSNGSQATSAIKNTFVSSLVSIIKLCLILFVITQQASAIELSDLPKFRSLKVSEANIRSGPGTSFPVKWVYIKKHIVLEIVDAYDNWYKIRDEEGRSGWLHKSLVSRKRFFVVKVEGAKLYRNPNDNLITYFLEQGIRGKLKNCRDKWCKVTVGKESGWVLKSSIWGVYAHETF